MASEHPPAVVIDHGSATCKAGLAGNDAPNAVFPSVVGRKRFPESISGGHPDPKSTYVGHEAQAKRSLLDLTYPISHGNITNWEDTEAIWRHTFQEELHLKPEEHQVLLTEGPMIPKSNREKMMEIMFETFSVPSVYIAMQAVRSLYSSGQTSGVILDSGESVTYSVPIHEGFSVRPSIRSLDLAGHDVTSILKQRLTIAGHVISSIAEEEIVRDIKEKICYVADDYASELEKSGTDSGQAINKHYTLPDGNVIEIGQARFQAPEILFQPSFAEAADECQGIHRELHDSIQRCNSDIRTTLYSRVMLAGGNTLLPNIEKRLENELVRIAPTGMNVNVIASPERKYSAWIGGSILASLSSFSTYVGHAA